MEHFHEGHELLQFNDFKELSNNLYYREYKEGETIFEIGSEAN